VRPRIYREMNPLRAGWAVRMTGPYTPAISGSVRTMLRVFESTFIYNYLFVDPCITSEPGKIIVNLNISPKKNSVPGSWYMISFYHPFDSRIPLYPLSSGDTAMHRRRATIYYRIPITLPSTSIGQVNFKVWLV
jgi:hypothetical protein